MSLQTFFNNFAILADAPNGVAKLRNLLFQLAVEGQLVPQNSGEEPAAKLLQRIRDSKDKLAKEAKVSKEALVQSVKKTEIPFSVPDSWEWVRLNQITDAVHYGYTASADHNLSDVRLLRITDIQNGKVDWANVPGCEIDEEKLAGVKLANDDIVIARTGGTIGKSYLVEGLDLVVVFASYLIRAVPNKNLFAKYLKTFLESELYWSQLYEKSMGTGQPNVNATSLKSLLVPLPPFEEQKRIVAKVDELMRTCDELESRQQARRKSRVRLNNVTLAPLNKVASLAPEEFDQAAVRLSDNFDGLYDSVDCVDKLRSTILQLAVQGKLVRQDPKEEHAIHLLNVIEEERKKLVRISELKKLDPTRAFDSDKLPLSLPQGWAWTRLGEISVKLGAGSTPLGGRSVYREDGDGIKFLRSQNVWNDGLRLDRVAYISEEIHQDMSGTQVEPGDVLLNITGASIGRSSVVPEDIGEANVSQHVSIIRLVDKKLRYFIHLCIVSPYIQDSIMQTQVGISREGLSMRSLKEFVLPIPPLEEQKRIVAKTNELMTLCDELEAKLRKAESVSEKLMNAALRHVLSSTNDAHRLRNSHDARGANET